MIIHNPVLEHFYNCGQLITIVRFSLVQAYFDKLLTFGVEIIYNIQDCL